MLSIYNELNQIDDAAALLEGYNVKHDTKDRGTSFNTLDQAIDYANKQMKMRKHDHIILFDDNNKELIWIDRYKDENNTDVGYVVARQDDKNLVFDKNKQMLELKGVESDVELRNIVVKEAGRLKQYRAAQKLAKMIFVRDNSKPTHIDTKSNTVYFNEQEQLEDAIKNLVTQLNTVTEDFENNKPPVKYSSVLTSQVGFISDTLLPIWKKAKAGLDIDLTKIKTTQGEYTLYVSSMFGISIGAQLANKRISLSVELDFNTWNRLMGHLQNTTVKPDLPLVLSIDGHYYPLKRVYTKNEEPVCLREMGKELEYLHKLLEASDFQAILNNTKE